MTINGFRNKFKQAGFYIPFTLYFFLFAIAGIIAWKVLHKNLQENETAFADIFSLLIRVVAFFSVILLGLALLSVLISLIFFLYKRKKTGTDFRLSTDLKESELHQKQTVRLYIHPVLKPFFGFVKLRLQYDEQHFSNKFSLMENKQNKLFSTTIEGTYHWPLPAIKEYHVQKAILYFEDVFQFFSFAVDLSASNHFFTQPTALDRPAMKVAPRKTEETTTRIEELRKVEGEYLNYKNFENNDDVRRIVWKIYAKNKELVVRIPEIMDPYASHIYLYASFFNDFDTAGSTPVEVPFLNYYKVMIWTVYQNLVKQGFDVRYIPDQELAKRHTGDEQQGVKYSISTSHWQKNLDLRAYCKTKDASVVMINSLSDAGQVQELIEKHGNDITFIFVKLTEGLKKHNMFDWVQWLFVQNEKNDMEVYKSAWATAFNLRPKITQNEKRLQEILEKYQSPVVV
jgi:hypothetical protein